MPVTAGLIMCNACGIYLKTHGRNRPVDNATGLGARTGFPLKRVCIPFCFTIFTSPCLACRQRSVQDFLLIL